MQVALKIFKYVQDLSSPETLLFLNDYGIILNKYHRFQLFQEQIRELLSSGAPINAIGLQSHIHIFLEKCGKMGQSLKSRPAPGLAGLACSYGPGLSG